MIPYVKAETIDEAVRHLADAPRTIVAGCTDYYCRPDARPWADPVLDISGLTDARGIADLGNAFRIGALTTWTDLANSELPPQFDALREAASQVGGVQIQNAGTIGGNLCNASPAADGVPALLILDAHLELRSAMGERQMPLAEFIVGNRQTCIRPDEMLCGLRVAKRSGHNASRFLKLGARAYQVISIVMVAALLETDAQCCVSHAAIAVGACSAVAQRLSALESALLGAPLGRAPLSALVTDAHLAPLSPLDDVRGTAAYRLDAARTLVGRALDDLQHRLA